MICICIDAGIRETTPEGEQSLLLALAHALLARGASKVWMLGGGAAAVTRRCEILRASVRFVLSLLSQPHGVGVKPLAHPSALLG